MERMSPRLWHVSCGVCPAEEDRQGSVPRHPVTGDAGTRQGGDTARAFSRTRVSGHTAAHSGLRPCCGLCQPWGRRRLLGANVTSPLPTPGSSGREPSPARSPVPGDDREGEAELALGAAAPPPASAEQGHRLPSAWRRLPPRVALDTSCR